ncbi:hypothetical protein CR513_38901, partial [Mucuna pruriens]
MERKECERVLTPHTLPLSTVCLCLALASLINKGMWTEADMHSPRSSGFGYSLANRQMSRGLNGKLVHPLHQK